MGFITMTTQGFADGRVCSWQLMTAWRFNSL